MVQELRKKAIILGCLLITVLLVGSLAMLIYFRNNMLLNNPGSVAELFVKSLMTNDIETALALVATDKRSEIELWVSKHHPYHCGNFAYDTGAASSGISLAGGIWNYGVNFQCDDPIKPYCISVTDIYVIKEDNKWQITDWTVVCEINNYCDSCINN
jgi:hypothetical protein